VPAENAIVLHSSKEAHGFDGPAVPGPRGDAAELIIERDRQ